MFTKRFGSEFLYYYLQYFVIICFVLLPITFSIFKALGSFGHSSMDKKVVNFTFWKLPNVLIAKSFFLLILSFSGSMLFAEDHPSSSVTEKNKFIPTIYYTGKITPNPQQAVYGEQIYLFKQNKPAAINIILSGNPSRFETRAAETLQGYLITRFPALKNSVQIILHPFHEIRSSALEIMLEIVTGDEESSFDQDVYAAYSSNLERAIPAEGYHLYIEEDRPSVVFLTGSEERGLLYGVNSLIQLFSLQEGDLFLRQVSILDYPSYKERISGNDEDIPAGIIPLQAVEWLSFLKFNGWAVGQSYWWPSDWRNTPPEDLQSLSDAAQRTEKLEFQLLFQVHPFGRGDDPDLLNTIIISDPEERKIFNDLCLNMLSSGAKGILLRADDYYQLAAKDEHFYDSIAEAHADLINSLWEEMQREFPNSRLFFCPPYYWSGAFSSQDGYEYITRLSRLTDREVIFIWTGKEVISHLLTAEEITDYYRITGRMPLLWDNTVLAGVSRFNYPYRYALYLFQPFETEYPANHHEITKGIRFNLGFDGSERNKVANIVLADYLWNPQQFNADRSLRNSLSLVIGTDAVETALDLADNLLLAFDLSHSPAYLFSVEDTPAVEKIENLITRLTGKTTNDRFIAEMEEFRWRVYQSVKTIDQISEQRNLLEQNALLNLTPGEPHWEQTVTGAWDVVDHKEMFPSFTGKEVFRFSHPFRTPGFSGSKAEVSGRFNLPESPTGEYYLHFIADNDYYKSGEPPLAWPGYYFTEIEVDGRIIWTKDVAGSEDFKINEIDITELISGNPEFQIKIRGTDKKGVYNLGVTISVSQLYLSPYSLTP
jgi:hypothetical protein